MLSNVQTTEGAGPAHPGKFQHGDLDDRGHRSQLEPLDRDRRAVDGYDESITQILVAFSKPLVASAALNPANFALVNVGADGMFGTKRRLRCRAERGVSMDRPDKSWF